MPRFAEGVVAVGEDAVEIEERDALLDGDGLRPAGVGVGALADVAGLPVAMGDGRAEDGGGAVGDGVHDELAEVPAVGVDDAVRSVPSVGDRGKAARGVVRREAAAAGWSGVEVGARWARPGGPRSGRTG